MSLEYKFKTREGWLTAAANDILTPFIVARTCTIPVVEGQLSTGHDIDSRISVGWPKGKRTVIGQCWYSSEDKIPQIFISPELIDPSRVIDVLLHEMIHARLGGQFGHKKEFKRLALACGLEGKMTATVAGEWLKEEIENWVKELGVYPHSQLDLSKAKKQTTRLLKCSCESCGYIARVTSKWIDEIGAPICPCNNDPMTGGQ